MYSNSDNIKNHDWWKKHGFIEELFESLLF